MEMEIFGPVGEPRYQNYSADIHASSRHLLSLIEDILDFSILEAGQMKLKKGKVNVAKVIESSLSLLKRRKGSGEIKLAVRIAKNLPALRGDERRMRQVLFNLVSNASKFIPAGGKVSLSASVGTKSDLRIQVEDTGVGIKPEDILTALPPFGQNQDARAPDDSGTGLRLPLAKSLVERHGGKLNLASEPGKGIVVSLNSRPCVLSPDRPLASWCGFVDTRHRAHLNALILHTNHVIRRDSHGETGGIRRPLLERRRAGERPADLWVLCAGNLYWAEPGDAVHRSLQFGLQGWTGRAARA